MGEGTLWEAKSPVPPRLSKEQVNELREALSPYSLLDAPMQTTSPALYSVHVDPRPQGRLRQSCLEERQIVEESRASQPVQNEIQMVSEQTVPRKKSKVDEQIVVEAKNIKASQPAPVTLPFGMNSNAEASKPPSTGILSPWFLIGGPPTFGQPDTRPATDPETRKQLKRNRRQAAIDAIQKESEASKRSRNNIRLSFERLHASPS